MTLHQVCQLELSPPEVSEEPHFQLTSFRETGKIFKTAPLDGGYLHLFIPEDQRDAPLMNEPDFLEELRRGKRVRGLRAILASAKAEVVKDLLSQACLTKAPKNLLASSKAKQAS